MERVRSAGSVDWGCSGGYHPAPLGLGYGLGLVEAEYELGLRWRGMDGASSMGI